MRHFRRRKLLCPSWLTAWMVLFLSLPANLSAQEEVSYLPLGNWRAVTSAFGYRDDPIYPRSRQQDFHRGIDLAAQVGDSVFAWRSGIVAATGYTKTSGNMIKLRHANGYVSKYHHLYRILVEEGQVVQAGQLIGRAGRSGRVSGPHLHFSIVKDNQHQDPFPYLKTAREVPKTFRQELNPTVNPAEITVHKQVYIKSQPVEGQVYIDGKYAGLTPVTAQLPYGEHFVEITAGENYQNFVGRLWIDRDSNHIFLAQLQPKTDIIAASQKQAAVAGGEILDEDDDFTTPSVIPNRFGGLLLNAAYTAPANRRLFSHTLNRAVGIDAGYGKFLNVADFLVSDHFLELRFTLLFGGFDSREFLPDPTGSAGEASAMERLENLIVTAASIGYSFTPRLSDRLSLLLGGEVSVGRMRVRGYRYIDIAATPGVPAGEGEDNRVSYKFAYIAPAYSAGAILFLQDNLALVARYYQTVFATDANWSGIKVGLFAGLGR